MKKHAVIFLLVFALVFGACSEIPKPKPKIELPIAMTVRLSGSDSLFQANITETQCMISFDESHPLSGTELCFDESGGKATVGDFTRDVDISIFPAQNALLKAIRGICSNENSGSETEKGTKYAIDEMTIMVYYDEDAEQIIGIGTEESGRRFDFDILSLEPYEIQSNSPNQP